MALQTLPNNQGMFIHSDNCMTANSLGASTIDAAGESRTYIGKVFLEGGSGSKTISSAGGAIRWRVGAVTFANAGTTVRIGIQDVASTGLEDGTFDVYDDLVGGTDTITANADQITTMTSGTKTITHGDLIAISIEMTAKGGSDSVSVQGMAVNAVLRNSAFNFPYVTNDTGSGPVKANSGVIGATIHFDDGTLGWIEPGPLPPAIGGSVVNINTGTNPDELACVFQVPFKCRISGGYLTTGAIGTADGYEIILYSDPTGTPTVIETITGDPFINSNGTQGTHVFKFSTPRTLSINTDYALALRPTTANNIQFGYIDFGSGNHRYKTAYPFGSNMELMGRTNQSGAFSSYQLYYLPIFGLLIDQLDDGVSTGGAESGFLVM